MAEADLRLGVSLRRAVRWFAAALLVAALAACGGSDSSPTPPATPPPGSSGVEFSTTDLIEGDGDAVENGWLLAISYTGWVYDASAPDNRGAEFANQPFSFRLGVGQVIGAVERGLPGMRVGGTRRIVAPPELAFGAAGFGSVPPNAAIVLEIELIAAGEVPFATTDIRVGDGEEATNGSSLTVVYRGWLYELTEPDNQGDLFDSTTADSPYRFTLGTGSVIAGWDLGVVGMRVGGLRQLVIPHQLAYGTNGRGNIPGYATLLFEVELLAIE